MEPTIIPGDYVLVNKLAYGARLFDLFDAVEGKKVNIRRAPGYTRVKNNDVVVFHIPHPNTWDKIEMNMSKYFIKRCIGVPGDTLRIINGFYVINADTGKRYGNIGGAERQLSRTTKEQLPEGVFHTFPWDSTLNWNIKDFGPLYIPRKGDKIVLERTNSLLYKKNNRVGERLSAYPQQRYIVGQCYSTSIVYFLAQLLFYGRRQSRKLAGFPLLGGLLPDDLIVGKAAFIWKSKEPYSGKIRWNRVFKKIE